MTTTKFDVVMLSTAHQATDHRIFHREARTLVEGGLSVCVAARHPVSEVVDGIFIEALPTAKCRLKRLLLGWTAMKAALRLRGGVYIFHDPELFVVGLLLRLLGKEVIYDARENLPMVILQKDWIPAVLRYPLSPALYVAEWVGARLLSGITVATPVIQKRFPQSRTVLVRNYPTAEGRRTLADGPPLRSRKNIVIYAGGLTRIRGIREVVQSFEGISDAELWLVGDFYTTQFKNELLGWAPPNVRWLGSMPHREVLKLYQNAKIGVGLLHPAPNHRNSLPVKFFEYLAAGLPIIASNFPEFRELVEGCGVQVDPHDVLAIRAAIKQLLSDPAGLELMSARARARVVSSFSWEPEGRRLLELCSRLLSRRSAATHRTSTPTANRKERAS